MKVSAKYSDPHTTHTCTHTHMHNNTHTTTHDTSLVLCRTAGVACLSVAEATLAFLLLPLSSSTSNSSHLPRVASITVVLVHSLERPHTAA